MPDNQTDERRIALSAQGSNLPMAPQGPEDEAEDDGIFLSWPGWEDSSEHTREFDSEQDEEDILPAFDEEDGIDYALGAPVAESEMTDENESPRKPAEKKTKPPKKPKQNKKKKRAKKQSTDGAAPEQDGSQTYAFRRAAASDLEESSSRRKKKQNESGNESDNESTLSSIKYYKHTAHLREIFLRRLLPALLALVFVVGFVLYFFRLQHLTFDNLRSYDAEEVFRALDIRRNQFIFTIRDGAIERKLRTQFPYIEDVRVEYELPDTVHLVFTEDSARFYTQVYDEFFVISQSMRVLARYDSKDELPEGMRMIQLPAVSHAVVGHPLRFFDTSYMTFLKSFLNVIEEAEIYRGIASMDLSNRFEIVLNYEERLSIELGSDDNLETRLLFVKSTIDELKKDDRGIIHIIDNKQAIYSPESRDS